MGHLYIYHGYVSHNQRVTLYFWVAKSLRCLKDRGGPGSGAAQRPGAGEGKFFLRSGDGDITTGKYWYTLW